MCSGDYQRGRPTTGPRLVVLICDNFRIIVVNVYRSFSPSPQKKPWPTWETHDWPVTPEYVLTLHIAYPSPISLSRCFLFVGGGVFCFLCMVVVDFTMSKYISPWHLSLLCSIYTLTHSQQSATGSTNVGDLRLVSK